MNQFSQKQIAASVVLIVFGIGFFFFAAGVQCAHKELDNWFVPGASVGPESILCPDGQSKAQ
jgi:hypothetical protein